MWKETIGKKVISHCGKRQGQPATKDSKKQATETQPEKIKKEAADLSASKSITEVETDGE